jgi:succinate-acetate transporter protein
MAHNEPKPDIFALLLFGYSLAVLGVELLLTHKAAGALVFGIFIAGVAESISGMWEISRGETLLGTTMATFGLWLFGLFLLETIGRTLGLVSPTTLGTYFLVLLVPIAILAIPPFKNHMGWPIRGAFAALFLLVLFAGVEFVIGIEILGLIAGILAWISAFFIWVLAIEEVVEIGGTPSESGESSSPPEHSDVS